MKSFNTPPGWPAPPLGWLPGPGWLPDPSWPPAPADWDFGVGLAGDRTTPPAGATRPVKALLERGQDLGNRALTSDRLRAAASRTRTLLEDERTKELIKRGARAGLVAASEALVAHGRRTGHGVLASVAEAALATTGETDGRGGRGRGGRPDGMSTGTEGPPRPGPEVAAALLAERRRLRDSRKERPLPGGEHAAPYWKVAELLPRWTTVRHPELPSVSVEDSMGLRNAHVLVVESPLADTRVVLGVSELESDWWVARHREQDLPVLLRLNINKDVEYRFLQPTLDQKSRLKGSPTPSTGPTITAGQVSSRLRAAHEDTMAVIRNLRA